MFFLYYKRWKQVFFHKKKRLYLLISKKYISCAPEFKNYGKDTFGICVERYFS